MLVKLKSNAQSLNAFMIRNAGVLPSRLILLSRIPGNVPVCLTHNSDKAVLRRPPQSQRPGFHQADTSAHLRPHIETGLLHEPDTLSHTLSVVGHLAICCASYVSFDQ
jgi:hypothetical protein